MRLGTQAKGPARTLSYLRKWDWVWKDKLWILMESGRLQMCGPCYDDTWGNYARTFVTNEVQTRHLDRGDNLGREGFSKSLKSLLTCVYFYFLFKCHPFVSPSQWKARAYVQEVGPHNCVSTCSGDSIVIGTGRKRLVSQLVLFSFPFCVWLMIKASFPRGPTDYFIFNIH